jgi:hypothetical protein
MQLTPHGKGIFSGCRTQKTISKLSKKRFSKGMTYSYFGNGKKQVHGVETTVAVIKVLESSIYSFQGDCSYAASHTYFVCSDDYFRGIGFAAGKTSPPRPHFFHRGV